jgi:hypothetical protein
LASISASVSTKGQYWISDKPLTEEEWIAEFCTGARDDAQTLRILDSVQKLEIEARDKKIAALEEEIRKLREAALRNDPAVAMKKIPRRATADFLWPNCHKSEDSLIFRSPPVPLDTPSC